MNPLNLGKGLMSLVGIKMAQQLVPNSYSSAASDQCAFGQCSRSLQDCVLTSRVWIRIPAL